MAAFGVNTGHYSVPFWSTCGHCPAAAAAAAVHAGVLWRAVLLQVEMLDRLLHH